MNDNPDSSEKNFKSTNIINLNSGEDRERISHSALRAYLNIVDKWQINEEQADELLGNDPSSFNEPRNMTGKTLDSNRLIRISYLIGIVRALHQLYGGTLADKWVKMPNQNSLFNGGSPLDLMRMGGVEALKSVRIMLDSRQNTI